MSVPSRREERLAEVLKEVLKFSFTFPLIFLQIC
jgi:hypothetical protein